jgi:DNA repair exonuclease SbcCD ATPase subunit
MARLSGLPSEHHHEGPGDAPRRKRGRPSKSQMSSQSQSLSQSQEVASTGKRTASPTAESSHTKRTKHVEEDNGDDEDQIAEEIQQSFSRSQQGDTIRVDTQSSQTTTTRHNGRRHSEYPRLPTTQEDDDDDDIIDFAPISTQSSSGLTPHLNRVGAVRRDMATIRRVRKSLPAQLGVERVDEEIDGTQFQYAPLSAVLDGRTRRRLRRSHLSQEVNSFEDHQKKDKKKMLELREQLRVQDEKIKDLTFQLEARRLGDIEMADEDTQELERKLVDARQEVDALRASSLYNGSDRDLSVSVFDGAADMSDDEDDHVMLVHPDDLNLSRDIDMVATPTGKYASRVQELSSQMTFESLQEVSQLVDDSLMERDFMEEDDLVVPDKIEDKAVERYERELRMYVRQLAESQGALRIVTLELQNLHFLEKGSTSTEIIVELRHSFGALRHEIEKFFPGTTDHLTNQQLLRKIPELFGGIFFELKKNLTELHTSQKNEVLLRRQYEGVLDLLADSEERIKELEQTEYSLDKGNEEKQRTIVDLEEQVTTLTDLTNGQEAEIKDKNAQINGLEDEIADKDTDLGRLRVAIEKYRQDLDTITVTATTFEAEHHAMIARMEEEHGDAVRALQIDLNNEQDAREAAEGDAMQKGEYIGELEGRIERLEADLEELTTEMTQLGARLAEQTEARTAAEGQRDEQAEIAYEFSNKIENLDETIMDLRAQIEEFKQNLATERAQRERTEADLDEANDKIEGLNQQVHNTGISANELRSKLFQLQQEKEHAIAELKEEAQEREDDLNDQLNTEAQAREVAEKTVDKLNKQIEQLQADLATTDIDLTNMTEARQQLENDREQQMLALNQQLADMKAKYTALETSTQSTIDALQANIIDLNNQVQRQQSEIKRLAQEVVDRDARYEQDTTVLKEEIVELKDALADERDDNAKYKKENKSLSERVAHEAHELLNMVNSHSEESNALKDTIRTLEATIRNHQANAAQYATEYEESVNEFTRQIEELQLLGNAHVETITILTSQIEDLKARFAKQEEDTRVTIDALNLSHRRLLEENEALAAALKNRNAATLKTVQDMKAAKVVIKTVGGVTDPHKVQTGKVVKTTEKVKVGKKGGRKGAKARSWRDSGMFDEEDDTKGGSQEVDDAELLEA